MDFKRNSNITMTGNKNNIYKKPQLETVNILLSKD